MFSCLVRDITERKRAEEERRASEERFRSLVANVPGIVYQRRIDNEGQAYFTYMSDQVREVLGLDPADVVRDSWILFDRVHPEDRQATFASMLRVAREGTPIESMLRITAASGEEKFIRLVARPRATAVGPVWDGLLLDVTASVRQGEENKLLEARLRQAQKLESLGTLAGGIAHEFNNMLVPISGLTELAMREIPPDTRAYNNMRAVLVNSRRAAQLVEKILSFARQEDSSGVAINLADVVAEAVELLGATSPATIRIRTKLDREVGTIYAGEVQIHQILMNLASNARHAMEGRVGELFISAARVDFDRPFEGRFASLRPGSYAKLSVKDTGHGMDAATLERIFEPFFTTKEVGKGTGLGLAVIHGIVAAHGGGVEVTSTPGEGTTFDIYFPRIEERASAQAVA
jgi:PAS domain S-box-containing protein